MDKFFYIGHTFLGTGMMPDPGKVKVGLPHMMYILFANFMGLASYCRRYVNGFAAVAAPLHFLTQKDTHSTGQQNVMQFF